MPGIHQSAGEHVKSRHCAIIYLILAVGMHNSVVHCQLWFDLKLQ